MPDVEAVECGDLASGRDTDVDLRLDPPNGRDRDTLVVDGVGATAVTRLRTKYQPPMEAGTLITAAAIIQGP